VTWKELRSALDELTTGLDPQARHAIWELVTGIKERGKTVALILVFLVCTGASTKVFRWE
jgi:ABC-type cobalamin/Fe3+-siderophores transport system ATPase subunit